MLIDCDTCLMNATDACKDCVVSCLLADGPPELSDGALAAIDNLADVGLVPRLRLVTSPPAEGEGSQSGGFPEADRTTDRLKRRIVGD